MLRRLTGCLTPSLLAVRCQSSLQSGCYGHADGVVRLNIPSNQSVLITQVQTEGREGGLVLPQLGLLFSLAALVIRFF